MRNNIITKQNKDLKTEVLEGLLLRRKRLPSKLFYDEKGSELFEQITRLEEYYPTRTESGIMRKNIEEICSLIKDDTIIIELGSGSSTKTRLLFDYANDIAMYIPVDISESMLMETVVLLSTDYPELPVYPITADYTGDFMLPRFASLKERIVYFPGSTIGNLTKKQVVRFLKRIAGICSKEGGFLVGIDLKKDKNILYNAYNDKQGITAEFNLHILERINNEFCAGFRVENFRHKAVYNEDKGRIEMYLISNKDQVVNFDGRLISFTAGESILTEYSYKYTVDEFRALASKYFYLEKYWTDENNLFAVLFLKVK